MYEGVSPPKVELDCVRRRGECIMIPKLIERFLDSAFISLLFISLCIKHALMAVPRGG